MEPTKVHDWEPPARDGVSPTCYWMCRGPSVHSLLNSRHFLQVPLSGFASVNIYLPGQVLLVPARLFSTSLHFRNSMQTVPGSQPEPKAALRVCCLPQLGVF